MRISDARLIGAATILALAACSPGGGDNAGGEAAQPGGSPTAASELIECALDGAAEFTRECEVEAAGQGAGAILLVRHPDGGFRRFEVLPERRGLAPADGAELANMEWREGGVGLAVGDDRYRFPAALVGDAAE